MHVLHFITMANFGTLASNDTPPQVKPLLNFLEKQFRKAHSLLNKQLFAPKTCENLSLPVLRQKPT